MLYPVWTNFTLADLNVDLEASAAVDLYRLADGLPELQRAQLKQQALGYVQTAVHDDWPAMRDSKIPEKTMSLSSDMWRTLMSVKAATPNEITAEDHAISELSALNEHRRTRILQSTSRLPGVLWWVLVAGGIMTVTSACMFGSTSARLHAIQVSSLALLITLVLVAIADIHRPFQGAVHVRSYAFERARDNMLAK